MDLFLWHVYILESFLFSTGVIPSLTCNSLAFSRNYWKTLMSWIFQYEAMFRLRMTFKFRLAVFGGVLLFMIRWIELSGNSTDCCARIHSVIWYGKPLIGLLIQFVISFEIKVVKLRFRFDMSVRFRIILINVLLEDSHNPVFNWFIWAQTRLMWSKPYSNELLSISIQEKRVLIFVYMLITYDVSIVDVWEAKQIVSWWAMRLRSELTLSNSLKI